MPKHSLFTGVVLDLREEVRKVREEAQKNPAVAFMREEVSGPQAFSRLAMMSPRERVQFMSENGGPAKVAEMVLNRPGHPQPRFPERRR